MMFYETGADAELRVARSRRRFCNLYTVEGREEEETQ